MKRDPSHPPSTWLEHAGPALVITALVALLWNPAVAVSPGHAERRDRIAELAGLLGEPVVRSAPIERVLPSATPFPPSAEATRTLADALAECGMSTLSEAKRVQFAALVYAITTGADLPRAQLDVWLGEIRQAAIDARCSPVVVSAIVDSARRIARTDPNPRRDWW